jgi:ABC-type sugar transport system substrate-binding protein
MNISMRASLGRGVPLALLAAALLVVGCGSSDSSSTSGASGSGTATTSSTDAPGIAKAQKIAADAESIPGSPFTVKALAKPAPKDVHVAYVTCTLPQCGQNDAKQPAAALGWKLDTIPYDIAKGPTDEIRGLRQAYQKGAKYVIFGSAFDPKAMAGAFAEAKAKGVHLVAFGYPEPPKSPIDAVMAGPPYFAGLSRLAAIGAIADAGKPTVIGYARDPSIPAYKTVAYGGVTDAVQEFGAGTKVKTTDYSSGAAAAQTVGGFVNFIRRNPDVKYFISPNPTAFNGLPQALRQANLADKVKLIVVEPQAPDVKSIKNGEIWAGAAGENHALLHRAMDFFARMENGEKLGEDLTYPTGWTRLITQENADKVSGTSATADGAPVPDKFNEVYAKAWGVAPN